MQLWLLLREVAPLHCKPYGYCWKFNVFCETSYASCCAVNTFCICSEAHVHISTQMF